MNKQIYLNALNDIYNVCDKLVLEHDLFKEQYNLLKELIDEHFDKKLNVKNILK